VSEFDSFDCRQNELQVLAEVAKALTAPLSLPELLEAVMSKIDDTLETAEFGVVLLWDPSEGVFRPQSAYGKDLRDLGALRSMALREGESITGKVYAQGRARLISSPEEVSNDQADMQPENRAMMEQAFGSGVLPRSVVAAPLFAGGNRYGVLTLGTLMGPRSFSENDLSFVQTLADLIALAIDRARLEDEALSIQDAQKVDRLRAEVMATLSHELRTPLAAIKGYSTALLLEKVDWPDEKRNEFLGLIDEECENLQTMITDILDSSLIDVGQLSLQYQPVRLEHLALEIASEMQIRTDVHRLVVDFTPAFPIVDADPRRIKQVLRNILDNAIKYSPDGGLVMIRGEVRQSDVVVSIADQGVGISAEDLIPLFEKYFRVKSATGHHVPGTGLGLPVARAIVEAHKGRIWAQSKVGGGTTLYFSIPSEGLSAGIDSEDAESEGIPK
jgi:K+-sensing histidine kinase KdpD